MTNRGERRKLNFAKGRRKKKLAKAVCNGWGFEHDGQYIKGKIHCSCPMCSAKTNNRGRYGAAMNYKHSDMQKLESLDSQEAEYLEEENTNERCE